MQPWLEFVSLFDETFLPLTQVCLLTVLKSLQQRHAAGKWKAVPMFTPRAGQFTSIQSFLSMDNVFSQSSQKLLKICWNCRTRLPYIEKMLYKNRFLQNKQYLAWKYMVYTSWQNQQLQTHHTLSMQMFFMSNISTSSKDPWNFVNTQKLPGPGIHNLEYYSKSGA